MQRHWLVTLQNLAATGRQWDTDVSGVLLQDQETGSVRALSDLVSDVHWRAELEHVGDVYRLCGQWHGLIRRQCSRCNAEFDWQAEGQSAWEFQLGDEPQQAESESVCEYVAPPGEINLLDLLREDIWLAWKADVICSDSCQGLCQGCGVDLNREPCQCAQDNSDHPFAALRDLKLGD
ncbi:MAG: DUF177 domain-containing protein [Mariprofundus sp.]|nr:DUF177 domain-containing protein [Mariprofundus sp.]